MKKHGFTIVETSLVLAIGGMILVLAFVVLPNLWRTQRDDERKSAIMLYADKVTRWASNNNRGSLPSNSDELIAVKEKYIGEFVDPSGEAYSFVHHGTKIEEANNALSAETKVTTKIHFVTSAACGTDNKAVKSSSPRKAAILYKLEAGEYCHEI